MLFYYVIDINRKLINQKCLNNKYRMIIILVTYVKSDENAKIFWLWSRLNVNLTTDLNKLINVKYYYF